MNDPSYDQNELLDLLGALRDEQLTPEQARQLENILGQNPAARRFYVRFMTIHGLLEQAAVAVPPGTSVLPTEKAQVATPLPRIHRSHWKPLLVLAATVLVGVLAWWLVAGRFGNLGKDDNPGQQVAQAWQVTPAGNAQFQQVAPNLVRLERGEVRIRVVPAERPAQQPEGKLDPMTVETPAGTVTVNGPDVLIGTHPTPVPQEGGAPMRHLTRVLVLAGMATLVNPHGSITGEADNLLAAQADQAPTKLVVQANNRFAVDLYRQLAKENGGKNLFFSPYSISNALTMTAEGARGDTAQEMGKVLHFPGEARRVGEDAQLIPWKTALLHTGLAQLNRDLTGQGGKKAHKDELNIANALWAEKTYAFRKEFLDTLVDSYNAGAAFPCDFRGNFGQERQRINDWVAAQTKKRIENLLPDGALSDLTRLVLTNAIYFKGEWQVPFDRRQTKPELFTTLAGQRVKTPMMFGRFERTKFAFIGKGAHHQSLANGTAGNLRLVELPYRGGLSMVLIAPDNLAGFSKLEGQLSADTLNSWLGKLRAEEEVLVHLPRFKMAAEYILPATLQHLGMVRAFKDPEGPDGADFSGMIASGRKEMYLTGVYHKAFLAVNEEGAEAAAATAVVGGLKGPPPPPPATFRGDRPFLVLIRDPQSGTILFMGRVADAAGVANNDLGEAQQRSLDLARTNPTEHPLYKKMKEATGVALIRTHRDPSGLMELKADDAFRMILECRVALSLKGDLKSKAVAPLSFDNQVQEKEPGRGFCDFTSPNYTQETVLAIYQRQGNAWVVTNLYEADAATLLVASRVFSIPVEQLTQAAAVPGAKR